ncbi:sugar ABC transporter substrate-binding protein [Bacillota bacterium Meth-B3]
MARTKRLVSLLLSLMLALAAFVGVASAESSLDADIKALLGDKAQGIKVGITVGDLSSTWICAAVAYTTKLLEGAGAEVLMSNSAGDLAKQVEQINDYVTMGCKIILIHTSNTEGIASTVQKAVAEGVTCVGFNIEIGNGAVFTCTSSDNVATGYSSALWLAEKAKEEGVKNAKIACIQGTMTQSDAYLRQEGIDKVAAEYGLELIQCPSNWSADEAEKQLSDVLTASDDIFGIITHCDSMDSGVISALKQAGYGPRGGEKHIYWSGIDSDSIGIKALEDGWIDVEIEQNPLALATVTVKGVLDYVLAGKADALNKVKIPMETRVVTKEDIGDSTLWGYFDYENITDWWSGTVEAWNHYMNI